jgi:hypothetical protein
MRERVYLTRGGVLPTPGRKITADLITIDHITYATCQQAAWRQEDEEDGHVTGTRTDDDDEE